MKTRVVVRYHNKWMRNVARADANLTPEFRLTALVARLLDVHDARRDRGAPLTQVADPDSAALPGAKTVVIEGPLNEAVPFAFRTKFPPNFNVPAHWHPVLEHVTVISGTFNLGLGDKLDTNKTTALTAGSFVINPPRTAHFAWTSEETIIQVHGTGPWGLTFVNPADDPRKKD